MKHEPYCQPSLKLLNVLTPGDTCGQWPAQPDPCLDAMYFTMVGGSVELECTGKYPVAATQKG